VADPLVAETVPAVTLDATTVTVYAVPAVRPVMVQVVADAPVAEQIFVTPPTCGDAVAVKAETSAPATAAPGVQPTTTEPTPAVAVTPVGVFGTGGAVGVAVADPLAAD
jgi:hypothetical protein